MILNFSLDNFGSFKDKQLLSFEATKSNHLEEHFIHNVNGHRILKMALIYGANASGKSTLINGLEFLRNLVLFPEDKKTNELKFEPFLFDSEKPNQESVFEIDFIQNGVKYAYEVAFNKKAILKEELHYYKPNKAVVFTRTTDTDKQVADIRFGSKVKKSRSLEKALKNNTLWNNTVLGGYLKTNVELEELKEAISWFNEYLSAIIYTKSSLESSVVSNIEDGTIRKIDVLRILKQADFHISDISIDEKQEMPEGIEKMLRAIDMTDDDIEGLKKNPPRNIKFEHTVGAESYTLPIQLESEGTRRYFELAGLLCLLIKKSKGISIDELESSLHPDLFVHFLLSFITNSFDSQIIATTHNREVLNNRDIFRDDAIWITDKATSCNTTLYSMADFDSSIIRDSSNRLNAYKSGKLGGVPNLGDFYIDLAI